ncbi:MAG TPA: hypothetical protein PLV83_02090 [Bacilli bacterium]|nr:hypothetical protein [Bacilli bacterium]
MKEAAGEANLTVIAIILIAVIAAVVTPVVNSLMKSTAKKSCCSSYGGTWENNQCMSNGVAVSEATYYDSETSECK